MKIILRALFVIGSLITIAACNKPPRTPDEVAHEATSFKVALLTGAITDAGWNAAAYDGMQHIKDNLAAESELVQTTPDDNLERVLRDFARRGFNLIFANGFEYTDATVKVAKDFPKTMFVVTAGGATSSNVASLNFRLEQAAYVEGVLAGSISKSGIAGAIGGMQTPGIKLTFDGFTRGFQSVNPHGKVLISFTGSFDDVVAARKAATIQIAQHADVLISNADAAGLGVFQAAAQAHIYAFGSTRTQYSMAPEVVLASAVADIADAFLQVASKVKSGTFKAGIIELGMKDGMVKLAYNPKLKELIPKDAIDRANAAEKEIIGGMLILGPATFSK